MYSSILQTSTYSVLINRIDLDKANLILHSNQVSEFFTNVWFANDGNQVVRFQGAARSGLIGIWCDPSSSSGSHWLSDSRLYSKSEPFGEKIQFEIWTDHEAMTKSKKRNKFETAPNPKKKGRVSRTCVQ